MKFDSLVATLTPYAEQLFVMIFNSHSE